MVGNDDLSSVTMQRGASTVTMILMDGAGPPPSFLSFCVHLFWNEVRKAGGKLLEDQFSLGLGKFQSGCSLFNKASVCPV